MGVQFPLNLPKVMFFSVQDIITPTRKNLQSERSSKADCN